MATHLAIQIGRQAIGVQHFIVDRLSTDHAVVVNALVTGELLRLYHLTGGLADINLNVVIGVKIEVVDRVCSLDEL